MEIFSKTTKKAEKKNFHSSAQNLRFKSTCKVFEIVGDLQMKIKVKFENFRNFWSDLYKSATILRYRYYRTILRPL